jgi:tetratricopeptide (TPR) repeat protein
MRNRSNFVIAPMAAVTLVFIAVGCSKPQETPASAAPMSNTDKSPVTTASDDARKEYIEGRSLAERLLVQDSIAHFDKAIALDPNFGLAQLGRANSSPTGTEFQDHLKKAVALADKLSNGEKLQILAAEAGSNAKAAQQKDYLTQLVAAYPQDERAHFALGAMLFGQQDASAVIEHLKKANAIAPDYSAPYNQLGYAYRQVGDYDNAERSFKKYIELIPNDPNPYDSYGELLLKMGRFDDSIVQYRKALTIDPNFLASHLGISADLMYSGKAADAAAEIQQIAKKARSDADQRSAMFATTSLAVYTGKMDQSLASLDQQYALGAKSSDTLGMVRDLQAKAAIYTDMSKPAQAQAAYEQAVKVADASTLSEAIKANIHLFQHANLTRVALARNDVATAKQEADAFGKVALASNAPGQVRQAHELAGMIALHEKNWEGAINELQQASQQDAYNLFRLCQAYQGAGNTTKATEQCTAAAHFNPLPELNFSFIHTKASKMASVKS